MLLLYKFNFVKVDYITYYMLCPRTTLQKANLIQNIIVGSSDHVEQGKHDFKDAVEGAYKTEM
jgi:hypothetical protein